jgi:hypothetical protein
VHAANDFPGVTALSRAVFRDDSGHGVIHFPGNPPNQGARTRDNGRNLKGVAEETL